METFQGFGYEYHTKSAKEALRKKSLQETSPGVFDTLGEKPYAIFFQTIRFFRVRVVSKYHFKIICVTFVVL